MVWIFLGGFFGCFWGAEGGFGVLMSFDVFSLRGMVLDGFGMVLVLGVLVGVSVV